MGGCSTHLYVCVLWPSPSGSLAHFTPLLLVKRNVRSPKQCLEAGFRFDITLASSNSTWFAVVFMFLAYDNETFY